MKYKPVNCGFYDHFEAAITLRKKVQIEAIDEQGQKIHLTTKPIDLLLENREEFLILENKQKIRLDHIVSFDGVVNPGTSCGI